MESKILMITPFHKQIRGNTVTALRISAGMEALGWRIDLCSLEERQKKEDFNKGACPDGSGAYGMIHGFHALYTGKALAEAEKLKRTPLLLTMTGTDLHSLRSGKDERMIADVLDSAAAIAVFNADFIVFLSSINQAWGKKTALIPQGVVLKDGKPLSGEALGLSEKEFIFILPSGLRAIKNIDLAVDALDIVYKRGYKVRLLIVGAVIEADYAERLKKRIHLHPAIKYLGAFNHDDMKPLLQLADVVVNCSLSEGQPQAVLEGMSLGKPCILTAVPGNLNIIENFREGIYVQNTKDSAAAMEFYLREPERTKTMGQAARELVENQFTAAAEIKAYHALYKSLVRD